MVTTSDWDLGFKLGAAEQRDGLCVRPFEGESEEYVRGYMQGYATACWHSAQDCQSEALDYFTPAEYRRGYDSVDAWDSASNADDAFYATHAEWRAMGS